MGTTGKPHRAALDARAAGKQKQVLRDTARNPNRRPPRGKATTPTTEHNCTPAQLGQLIELAQAAASLRRAARELGFVAHHLCREPEPVGEAARMAFALVHGKPLPFPWAPQAVTLVRQIALSDAGTFSAELVRQRCRALLGLEGGAS